MINIQEETRNRIEAKVSSLTSKLSDSINYMLEKKREDAAEAKKNNNLPAVGELQSDEEEDNKNDDNNSEFENFGI